MKKVWWKVPLYCMVASWICFQLEVHLLGRWAITTLPDGTITPNNTRWMIISGALFVLVVLIGGLVFFRKMTRKEIFYSASVLAIINVVMGLLTYAIQGMFALYWVMVIEWSSIVQQLLSGVNIWLAAAISWVVPPYLFVLFGKKEIKQENKEN